MLFFSKVPKEECHTEYDTDCHRIPYEKCDTHYEKKCRTEYRYFKQKHTHEFPVKILYYLFFSREVKRYKTENHCYWPQSYLRDEPCQ